MLRIDKITFSDSSDRELEIKKQHIETFPLIGGESANMIVTESWNQQGNTPTNAMMEAYEGELVFIIRTANKRPNEITEERRKIINICNPLNGVVNMTVFLNDGSSFNRDITFVSAPVFPVGLENRNAEWQKVQLLYSANNPFWYSETEIIETFQGVEPNVALPFEISGRTVFDKQILDYDLKVSGSNVANPNMAYYYEGVGLPTAYSDFTPYEMPSDSYNAIAYDLALFAWKATSISGERPLFVFKYNIVESLERRFGAGIWNGETTLSAKIAIAETLVKKYTIWVKGYGTINNGASNQMRLVILKDDMTYSNYFQYTDSTFTNRGMNSTATNNIHSDGHFYFIAYTEPSTGQENRLNVNLAWMELDVVLASNGEPFVFGNVIPSKSTHNEGQVKAPVVIKISGACVNPKIINETTGEFIGFKDLTMSSTDILEIDTSFGRKKVELNGVNIFNKLDFASTFFNLETGENFIDFKDDTGTKSATIQFIYRNLYITI